MAKIIDQKLQMVTIWWQDEYLFKHFKSTLMFLFYREIVRVTFPPAVAALYLGGHSHLSDSLWPV